MIDTQASLVLPLSYADDFLRPIPEDRSAQGSSSTTTTAGAGAAAGRPATSSVASVFSATTSNSNANSSTRGVRAGRVGNTSGSVVSDAAAVLADRPAGEVALTGSAAAAAALPATSPRLRRRRQRQCTVGVIVLVVAAVVAVVAAVFASNKNSSNKSEGARGPVDAPSPSPFTPSTTAAPSVDPDIARAVTDILESVTDPVAWMDADSSQSQALDWILQHDEFRDSLLLSGNENRLIQRYTLAVLSYNVMPIERNDEFLLTDVTECEWIGMSCDDADALTYLLLPSFNLTGALPPEFSALSSLRELDMNNNALTGTITDEQVASWQNVYWLDLSQNQLQGSVPAELWRLQVLRFVYLYDNLLTGTLDTSTTSSAFIQDAWLHHNMFRGSLPVWVTALQSLEQWISYDNLMTGDLPEFDLTAVSSNLTYFDVSSNKLSGTLPSSLFAVPALRFLYLDRNELRGSLPAGDQPAALTQVWLHSNRFTGKVPTTFGGLWFDLEELLMQDNEMTGTLGAANQCNRSWISLEKMEADCSDAAGPPEVTCVCCTACF